MFFIKNSLKINTIGAIASSSSHVIQRVVSRINNKPLLILEQGGGNGVMTKALLKKLSPYGKLIVIENNEYFIKNLQQIDDVRLEVFPGTVQEFYNTRLDTTNDIDYIISSIPFSFLSQNDREMIVRKSYEALSKNGYLIIFHQYS